MDELMDMMVSDESPSQISDRIKEILFGKAAERIDAFRPMVANAAFGGESIEVEDEVETEIEVDDDSVETTDGV